MLNVSFGFGFVAEHRREKAVEQVSGSHLGIILLFHYISVSGIGKWLKDLIMKVQTLIGLFFPEASLPFSVFKRKK